MPHICENRNINIYIEDKLLEKIYSGELRKRIMSPELEAIAVLRETLGSDYSDKRQRILNTAEKYLQPECGLLKACFTENGTKGVCKYGMN